MASPNAPPAVAAARKSFDDAAAYRTHRFPSDGWVVPLVLAAVHMTSYVSPRLAKLARSSRLWGWLSAIRRIYRSYHAGHGFYPSLISPARYTEKIQWRKLFDLNPLYAVLCDKFAVRDFVSERVGPEYLVPLLWVGSPDDIPFETLEPPYIIKSTHGTGQTHIVEDKAELDEQAVRKTVLAWLDRCHGTALDEPGYVHVPRRLVVEKLLLRADGSSPIERKIFFFHGTASVVQSVTVSRADRTRFVSHHTLNWDRASLDGHPPAAFRTRRSSSTSWRNDPDRGAPGHRSRPCQGGYVRM